MYIYAYIHRDTAQKYAQEKSKLNKTVAFEFTILDQKQDLGL